MSLEINTKLRQIKEAVERCGVIVTSVSLDTTLRDTEVKASPLPVVISLTLDVQFKLELTSSESSQRRLTQS